MSWRDEYRQASFRGAAFFVESTDSSYGRRQVTHEHAQRDVPYTEDLGRKAREFTVDGYLLGANYKTALNALISACEQAGPGQLVHPYRGELTVCLTGGLTVRESNDEGGMARVSMSFTEAGSASFPRSSIDSVTAISSAGNALEAASKQTFVSRFITDGFPGFVLEAATEQLQAIGNYLSSPGFNLAGEIQDATDFYYSARKLVSDAAYLVTTPATLADRLLGVFHQVRGAFGVNSFKVLTGAYSSFITPYPGTTQTPSRQQQAINYELLNELTRQAAISEAAKTAAEAASVSSDRAATKNNGASTSDTDDDYYYPSISDALADRDAITDAIDIEMERTVSDDVYLALGKVQTEVIKGVPQPGQQLPHLAKFTPPKTMPSLLVAHHLYGDASREEEITERNKPRHPGFMTGGTSLEVLADG
jgi:prophage DNA circulation protein